MTVANPFGPRARQSGPPRLYEPLDFVVVRTPILPVEFYFSTCTGDSVEQSLVQAANMPQVREAITSVSPSLARALATETAKPEDRNRALRKLRRYLIRMSTRPTPFGAFAAVAIGPLSRRGTTLRVDETRADQFHYLDIPWLLGFVRRIEDDERLFRHLKLQANPCAFRRGDRVFIREMSPLSGDGRTAANVSLRVTKHVARILDLAQSPIDYASLVSCIADSTNPTDERVHRFIRDLWRQELLLTNLRPPLTQGDPADYVLKRLREIPGSEACRQELEAASVARPAQARIAASPRAGAPNVTAQPAYRTETVVPVTGTLHAGVAEEAARTAELLLSLTSWPGGPPYLAPYRLSFEARYGSDRDVPLLEMIDPEFGIGLPSAYDTKKNPVPAGQSAAWRQRRDMLFELARRANDERRLEIDLDAADIRRLRTWTPDLRSAPRSLEINVFVVASSTAALDDGEFTVVVGPNIGSMEAGRSLGRFAQPLGAAGRKAYADAATAHASANPDGRCVELSYLPRIPHLANIIARPTRHQFEISVGLQPGVPFDQSIPVSNLSVSLRGGRFHVRSLALPGELRICSGHMANNEYAPPLCRLLTDLMLDRKAILRGFDWGVATMHHFLPRIRAGRAVLSVARWQMTETFLKHNIRLDSLESFRGSLSRWQAERHVPRHVHLTETDNRLVLDLQNEIDIADLYGELRRVTADRFVTLEEVYPALQDAWLPGTAGRFVSEYVVPLAVRPKDVSDQVPRAAHAVHSHAGTVSTTAADRVKPPGSDWLYIKLYTAPSLEDDLLLGPIRRLILWARDSGVMRRWFFVRYADPEPHIRLRLQGDPAVMTAQVLPKLLEWAGKLVEGEQCFRFAIDTYEREIDRYGGLHGIGAAEELFCHDSDCALAGLSFLTAQFPLLRHELAMVSLDGLLADLGWDSTARADFFAARGTSRQESGVAYRERKQLLEALAGLHPASSIGRQVRQLSRATRRERAAMLALRERFNSLSEDRCLSVPLGALVGSFAHMHCNRLGLDAAVERLAYGLLARNYATRRAVARRQTAVQAPRAHLAVTCSDA